MDYTGIEISEEHKTELQKRFEGELNDANKKANDNFNRLSDSVASHLQTKYGIEKLASETKITDYIERVGTTLAENSLKKHETVLNEKDVKISELQTKIDSGFNDEKLLNEHNELKKKFSVLNDSYKTEKQKIEEIEKSYNDKLQSYKIDNLIFAAMPEIDTNANKFEVEARKQQAIETLKTKYNLKVNDSNELIAENESDYSTTNAKEILTGLLKEVMPTTQNGGGANPPNGNNGTAHTLVFTKDMSSTEKDELTQSFLAANHGITNNMDSRFTEIYEKEYSEANKLLK